MYYIVEVTNFSCLELFSGSYSVSSSPKKINILPSPDFMSGTQKASPSPQTQIVPYYLLFNKEPSFLHPSKRRLSSVL